jgi:hypothetical protein|tara:strand:+ start:26371 stop:26811 length:441 start_codon:yes stop_codon:yes gene_type:complete
MKSLISEILLLQHERGIDLSKNKDREETARLIMMQLKCTKRREMANMSIIMRPYVLMVDKLNVLIDLLCKILVDNKLTVEEVSEKLNSALDFIKDGQELEDDWYEVAMDEVDWNAKREALLKGNGTKIRELVKAIEARVKEKNEKK